MLGAPLRRFIPDERATMDERIKASCTVDSLGAMHYEVSVWGQEPFDHHRSYTVKAQSQDHAAQEGMRLFVDEMGALCPTEARDD